MNAGLHSLTVDRQSKRTFIDVENYGSQAKDFFTKLLDDTQKSDDTIFFRETTPVLSADNSKQYRATFTEETALKFTLFDDSTVYELNKKVHSIVKAHFPTVKVIRVWNNLTRNDRLFAPNDLRHFNGVGITVFQSIILNTLCHTFSSTKIRGGRGGGRR